MEDNMNENKGESISSELSMDEETRRLFNVRKVQKSKKPTFKRAGSHKFKRLDSNWRRPRGLQGKQRRHYAGKGALAQTGYCSPRAVKGLHPCGYADILVETLEAVENVDASREAIRISGRVGSRKKTQIEAKAVELGIKILNPTRGE
ncbi:MAG: 50S ribosomal protein L32e [Methanosarcinaceae archaeon]|nr:50S ribosomal protein L32e [Methanosarcinaceae archaeon]